MIRGYLEREDVRSRFLRTVFIENSGQTGGPTRSIGASNPRATTSISSMRTAPLPHPGLRAC